MFIIPMTGLLLWAGYLTCMFIVVHIKKDISIGNFTWGGGVLLITLYTFFTYGYYLPRQMVVTTLITLWCLRLTVYVWLRYCKGSDPRYLSWDMKRQQWLRAFTKSFVWIFLLNGGFSLLMALPSSAINYSFVPGWGVLDSAALFMWLVGFFWESIGDYQLFRFMHNPAHHGGILTTGLWHYSRHPNYFGEMVMWWSIFLLAIQVPYGWYTIIAPLAITTSLLFVTGIPWIEQVMGKNSAYREYKKRTNMLIPWWPKK